MFVKCLCWSRHLPSRVGRKWQNNAVSIFHQCIFLCHWKYIFWPYWDLQFSWFTPLLLLHEPQYRSAVSQYNLMLDSGLFTLIMQGMGGFLWLSIMLKQHSRSQYATHISVRAWLCESQSLFIPARMQQSVLACKGNSGQNNDTMTGPM